MASNGTIENQFRTGYKVQAYWVLNSQNVANNTSNITVHAQLVSLGSSYTIRASSTKYGSITVNGTKHEFSFNTSLNGNETKTMGSKTIDIPHNSDGTKTIDISTTLGIAVTLSGTYWGNVTASGTATLNTIARKSSFTLNTDSATLGSTVLAVSINRASDAFKHNVTYKFGSISWTGGVNIDTYFEMTPSIDDATQIASSTNGVGSITVDTYIGETWIGSETKNITLYVPDSIKPLVSTLESTLITDIDPSYGYVKGKTKVNLKLWGCEGTYGSWITSYTITGGGFSSGSWDSTTGYLTNVGDVTFSGYCTDSRGRQSVTLTVTINVKDYMNPNIISFTANRCLKDGTYSDDGTYLSVYAEYSYNDLGGSNSVTTSVKYKATSSSVWVDTGVIKNKERKIIGGGDIDPDKSFEVWLGVDDKFIRVEKYLSIATAFVTMDFLKGGKGIGIGKVAEEEQVLDIALISKFRSEMWYQKGNITSNIAPMFARERLDLTAYDNTKYYFISVLPRAEATNIGFTLTRRAHQDFNNSENIELHVDGMAREWGGRGAFMSVLSSCTYGYTPIHGILVNDTNAEIFVMVKGGLTYDFIHRSPKLEVLVKDKIVTNGGVEYNSGTFVVGQQGFTVWEVGAGTKTWGNNTRILSSKDIKDGKSINQPERVEIPPVIFDKSGGVISSPMIEYKGDSVVVHSKYKTMYLNHEMTDGYEIITNPEMMIRNVKTGNNYKMNNQSNIQSKIEELDNRLKQMEELLR